MRSPLGELYFNLFSFIIQVRPHSAAGESRALKLTSSRPNQFTEKHADQGWANLNKGDARTAAAAALFPARISKPNPEGSLNKHRQSLSMTSRRITRQKPIIAPKKPTYHQNAKTRVDGNLYAFWESPSLVLAKFSRFLSRPECEGGRDLQLSLLK